MNSIPVKPGGYDDKLPGIVGCLIKQIPTGGGVYPHYSES